MWLERPTEKDSAACAVVGVMDTSGRRFNGESVTCSMALMHERSNGLGGGFAAYGIYPDYRELYAFHMMYLDTQCRYSAEEYLKSRFNVIVSERIPTRPNPGITDPPVLWRYFLEVAPRNKEEIKGLSDDEFVVKTVMHINDTLKGVYVFSSGKNMGVFKGMAYAEHLADFFMLEEYKGYQWIAHGRFPTNTVGWWGGAHPFNLLDLSVVHNGELSSYGTNKRHLEMFGYTCTLMTDTEVVAYAMHLLLRRHNLPLDLICKVMAPPLWDDIDRMDEKEREVITALRQVYASLLFNGPFSFIMSSSDLMVGLTDRIRLRPLVAATAGDIAYVATEESAIRLICPEPDEVWFPKGGEPAIARLKEPAAETVTA